MASASAIRAGRAFVEVFLRDERLQKGLIKAERRIRAFAAGASQLGSRLMGAGAALAAPLAGGAKVFVDFEQALANVSTMLDEPQRHMDAFRAGIRRLSVDLGESTDTLAKGLYDILSASVEPAAALDVLEVSARAAKAGLTDTGVAADAITTILNSYGLAADHAGDVSDWLFTIVKRGKTTFAELAPQIGLVASTASSAGVELDELGSMVALLTRNGVRTENAITAVNQVISQFLNPTAEASALAASLGFEMNSATLQAEGLSGVFRRIAGLPPDVVAKLFPNVRALRGVLPALKNLGELSDDLAAMGSRAGNTQAAFGKQSATLGHRLGQAKQAVLELAAAVGEALGPMLRQAAGWIVDHVRSIRQWIEEHQGMVTAAAKVAVGLLGAGVALKAFGAAASLAIVPLKALGAAATVLRVAGPLLASGLAVAGKAVAALAVAHPIGAALLALAAAGTAVGVALGRMGRSAAEAAAEAEKARQAVQAQGDESRELFSRLEQLGQQQRLSNRDMVEAGTIIATLEGRYGNLGIQIDRTTGKLVGLAAAQREVARAQAAREVVALTQEIRAKEAEFAEAAKQTTVVQPLSFSQGKWEDQARQRMDQLADEVMALKQLRRAHEAVATGKPARPTSAGPAAAASGGGTDPEVLYAQTNQQLLADIRRLEIQQLGSALDREIALVQESYDAKRRAAVEAGQDVALVERARQVEIQQIQARHAEQERELWYEIAEARIEATRTGGDRERALLELQLRQRREELRKQGVAERTIREREQAERAKAERDQARRDVEYRRDSVRIGIEAEGGPEEERRLFEYDLRRRSAEARERGVGEEAIREREQVERARFDRDQGRRERQAAIDTERARIEATMSGRQKELALFKLDEQERVREMQRQGLSRETIAGNIKAERAKFAAERIQQDSATVGTFSAAGAGLLGHAGGGVQERIRQGVEKTAENTNGLVDALAKLFVKWSA